MSEIKVYDKLELRKITDIKPYWRNPRKNDKTVEALKKIIPNVGFNVPLYIDKEGVIIKGHARYRAAVQLGLDKLPCIVSENSEEQNKIDRVSDNKISELAEWDIPELRYELEQISSFDMSEIGFESESIDTMSDFNTDTDFSMVEEKDFTEAKADIIRDVNFKQSDVVNKSQVVSVEDILAKRKEENKGNNSEETKVSKVVKFKCPHCGNELLVPLN